MTGRQRKNETHKASACASSMAKGEHAQRIPSTFVDSCEAQMNSQQLSLGKSMKL